MAELSLQHIDKIYDNNVQAVFDFNLDVKDGELIVLVGPSGCGKSTTLRMVAGLEDISNGKLLLDGTPAYVFEHEDELSACGLSVPQCTSLIHKLEAAGLKFEGGCVTIEQCAEILSESLKKGN